MLFALRTFAGQSGSSFWCPQQSVCSYFSQSRWFCVSLTLISSWILSPTTIVSLCALITCSCQTYKEQVPTSALCFSYLSPHAASTATAMCSQEMTPKWRQSDQAKPNQINQPTNQTDKNYLFLAEKIGAKKFIRPSLSVLVAREIWKILWKKMPWA